MAYTYNSAIGAGIFAQTDTAILRVRVSIRQLLVLGYLEPAV